MNTLPILLLPLCFTSKAGSTPWKNITTVLFLSSSFVSVKAFFAEKQGEITTWQKKHQWFFARFNARFLTSIRILTNAFHVLVYHRCYWAFVKASRASCCLDNATWVTPFIIVRCSAPCKINEKCTWLSAVPAQSIYEGLRGRLHATKMTFMQVRVHPGSLLWLCIHDTNPQCYTGASSWSQWVQLCQTEILIPVTKCMPVPFKRGMVDCAIP